MLRTALPHRTAALVAALGLITTAVFTVFFTTPVAFDDAYISFRYARAFLDGQGFVFNPEDGRLEGFTNLAWVLLTAAAMKLGADPLAFTRTAGLLSLAASLGALLLVARRAERRTWVGSLAVAVALIVTTLRMPGLVLTLGSGLETAFAGLLTLALGLSAAGALRLGLPALSVVSLLLAATRPDGLLFIGAAVLGHAWPGLPLGARGAVPFLRTWALGAVRVGLALGAPVAGLYLFRWLYFGDLVPNTYYAKSADLPNWAVGWEYWRGFLENSPHAPWLLAPLALSIPVRRRVDGFDVFLLTGLSAYVLYVAKVGGDFMYYRFAFQVLPVVLLAAALGATRLLGRWPWVGTGLAGALVGVAWWGSGQPEHLERRYGMQSIELMNAFIQPGRELGEALRKAVPPDTRISTTLAGTVPYYSQLFTVDEWGLNDRTIAHLPDIPVTGRGHVKKAPPAYLRERRVNLEIGHPVLCDCTAQCDDAFPQVYLRIASGTCVRMRYLTPREDLTRRFCTAPEFRVRHVDCGPRRDPDFDWRAVQPEAAPTDERPAARVEPLPLTQLLAQRQGVAFGTAPVSGALPGQQAVSGQVGALLSSFHGGDETTGWLETKLPPGVAQVRLKVGGGADCSAVFVGLVVDGRVAARRCGKEAEHLEAATLPVPPGAADVRLVVADFSTGPWGHLLVSDVTLEFAAAP